MVESIRRYHETNGGGMGWDERVCRLRECRESDGQSDSVHYTVIREDLVGYTTVVGYLYSTVQYEFVVE